MLEDPTKGFLANDTIIIKYTIELVVSTGTKRCDKMVEVARKAVGEHLHRIMDSWAISLCL